MSVTRQERPTVLILKDRQKEPALSNYWPITCITTTWKLQSSIIVTRMNRDIAYMSGTQKGINRSTREAKHQLLEERAVPQDCKTVHCLD